MKAFGDKAAYVLHQHVRTVNFTASINETPPEKSLEHIFRSHGWISRWIDGWEDGRIDGAP